MKFKNNSKKETKNLTIPNVEKLDKKQLKKVFGGGVDDSIADGSQDNSDGSGKKNWWFCTWW